MRAPAGADKLTPEQILDRIDAAVLALERPGQRAWTQAYLDSGADTQTADPAPGAARLPHGQRPAQPGDRPGPARGLGEEPGPRPRPAAAGLRAPHRDAPQIRQPARLRQPLRRGARDRAAAIGQPLFGLRAALTISGVTLGLLSAPARAADVTALYEADWAGLPAAHIRLTLHDAPGAYRSEIAIGSEGLPHVVTHFRGTAVAEGSLGTGNAPAPTRFDANYDLRKRKDRLLRMAFATRNGATVAERGPGDTSRKKALAEEFRRNVIDPLSALTAIQAGVRRGETILRCRSMTARDAST